jgi:hypothetical protein
MCKLHNGHKMIMFRHCRKPSKPDDALVAYIRQLELPLVDILRAQQRGSGATADEDGTPLTSGTSEEQRLMIDSVMREIRHREASLSVRTQRVLQCVSAHLRSCRPTKNARILLRRYCESQRRGSCSHLFADSLTTYRFWWHRATRLTCWRRLWHSCTGEILY